jgi:hypothetical protein
MGHREHRITAACPVDCLTELLSLMAFKPLARAYGAPFDPPKTVADVAALHRARRLREITGLGPRRIAEIVFVLEPIGLAPHPDHPHPDHPVGYRYVPQLAGHLPVVDRNRHRPDLEDAEHALDPLDPVPGEDLQEIGQVVAA